MNNLTEVKKDWKSIPYFKQYTPTKYYAILGCFVVGFNLISIPGHGEYRPHFVIYPLWKNTLKEVFSYPFVCLSTIDEKGLDIDIPYDCHTLYFSLFMHCCERQFDVFFNAKISVKNILFYLNIRQQDRIAQINVINKILLLECKWFFLLYINDNKGLKELLKYIRNNKDTERMKSINFWGKTYDEWLESLISMTNDRDTFLKQIEININSEKLRKLPRYNLIP